MTSDVVASFAGSVVFLHVDHGGDGGDGGDSHVHSSSGSGSLYVSGGRGVSFALSLEAHRRNPADGLCDFQKISSIEVRHPC